MSRQSNMGEGKLLPDDPADVADRPLRAARKAERDRLPKPPTLAERFAKVEADIVALKGAAPPKAGR